MRIFLTAFLLCISSAVLALNYSESGTGPAVFILYTADITKAPGIPQLRDVLVASGHKVVLVDIPCHGNESGELECWRSRIDRGITFDGYVSEVQRLMVRLNAKAVIGISRSGYLALLIASTNNKQVSYVLISPVVSLGDLQEFAGAKKSKEIIADNLVGKRIFLTIGRDDDRVNTQRSIELAKSTASITLLLTNTRGHFHADIDRVIVDWLQSGRY